MTHFKHVQEKLEYETIPAIREMVSVVNKALQEHPKAKIIIQGDFNSYPEYFNHKFLQPQDSQVVKEIKDLDLFKLLENAGLQLVRTGLPTELNSHCPSLMEREIDYLFTTRKLAHRVQPIELASQELSLATINRNEKTGEEVVHFDPMMLPSDHRPTYFRVKPELTGIWKLIGILKEFLARFFPFFRRQTLS